MKHTIILLVRWAAAIGFGIASYVIGSETAAQETGDFNAVMPLLYSIGLLMLAVICIAPELMHWGSIPIRMMFDGLFTSSERGVPPPDYNVTRVYCEQERYAEALEQYQQIIHYHPDEFLAYVEGIQLAFQVEEPEIAERLYKKGLSGLTAPETVEHLKRVYAEAEAAAREAAAQPADEEAAYEEGEELPPGEPR